MDNPILGELKVCVKKIPLSLLSEPDEVDSAWDLPTKSIVRDVFVDVTTAEATGSTKTIDIGLLSTESGGDADGFGNEVVVSATGIIRPQATVSDGTYVNYFYTNTRGVLLSSFEAGSDGGAGQRNGLYWEKPHRAGTVTAKSVSYTAGSSDFADLVADLYIVYDEIVEL